MCFPEYAIEQQETITQKKSRLPERFRAYQARLCVPYSFLARKSLSLHLLWNFDSEQIQARLKDISKQLAKRETRASGRFRSG